MKFYLSISEENDIYYVKAENVQRCFYKIFMFLKCGKENQIIEKAFNSMGNFEECKMLWEELGYTSIKFFSEVNSPIYEDLELID